MSVPGRAARAGHAAPRMTMPLRVALAGVLLFAALFGPGIARAAELRLLAANAVKDAVLPLVAEFERATGHTVITAWGGTDGVARRIGAGERADLVLIAAPAIDTLIAQGRLAACSRAARPISPSSR